MANTLRAAVTECRGLGHTRMAGSEQCHRCRALIGRAAESCERLSWSGVTSYTGGHLAWLDWHCELALANTTTLSSAQS